MSWESFDVSVLLTNSKRTIKVADFGVARSLASASFASTLTGTLYYLAPEVVNSQHYDMRADIWFVSS